MQSLLLGAAAALSGVLAGLAVGVILVKVVNLQSFGWSLTLEWPLRAVVEVLLWVAASCLVAALSPALSALRLAPAGVLREDS